MFKFPFISWKSRIRPDQPRSVRRKLRTRLLITLIPTSLIVLALMGYATYWASSEFIAVALERNSKLHAVTTAHAVESLLERCRRHLLFTTRNPLTAHGMEKFLMDLRELEGLEFPEFGYIPRVRSESMVFVSRAGVTRRLSDAEVGDIRPGPALLHEHTGTLRVGDVWVSDFGEVEVPFPASDNPAGRVASKSLRMITPYADSEGLITGFVYLAVDAQTVRNILSLYDSSKSPVFAFARDPKFQRYTYFFDYHGWVLFQSESDPGSSGPLRTLEIRSTFQGTLGRPGFPEAFRPSENTEGYWEIVADVQAGKKNILRSVGRTEIASHYRDHFLAYAPVSVILSADAGATVIGGVAYEDRSVLIGHAGYKHIDVMLAISAIAVVVLTFAIALVARGTTLGLVELAHAVKNLNEKGEWHEVQLYETGYEAEMIKESINSMIRTLRTQFEEIKSKDLKIESVALKEPAELSIERLSPLADDGFPEFVGAGPFMQQMKRDISKASLVDVDVLIEGETGTGKQLAAEAVHRLSHRVDKPFISINCGELDENLLLDSLFGHVKGAFTDGKGDRRGAFLEADGGTLFLDEIQSASLKVQQALLRALSLRKIKPLGSDKDIDVNVRLITATNMDLKKLIAAGKFREDLFYRLKVITIQTPPLRDQRQNIPALAMYFLKEGERMAGRSGLALSRGALKALVSYSWPGNIRELKHLIITAAVMAEGNVIQAEQLGITVSAEDMVQVLEQGQSPLFPVQEAGVAEQPEIRGNGAGQVETAIPEDLNRRQVLACKYVREHGSITSKELIDLLDATISKRTAGYDIQGLVDRGLLVKKGRGPSTRYVRPTREDNA
jgi:DNA-binding NtrC family response regulator